MKPLTILHAVASLRGGAAQQILTLSRVLHERGHRVLVAAPDDNPPLSAELEALGIGWLQCRLDGLLRHDAGVVFGALQDESVDVLHMHGHRAACCLRLHSKTSVFPSVYTVHGYHPPCYSNPLSRIWVNQLERWQACRADAFICVSEDTRDDLQENVPVSRGRCHVIPNAIAPLNRTNEEMQTIRSDIRTRFGIHPDELVVGCVARLQWQKAVHRLVEAFTGIPVPEAKLLLVGDGPERKRIQALISRRGLKNRVILAGAQPRARDMLHAMDLFVLPSLWEGLPLTVLEAWDAEVPVVATDVRGSRELIRPEHNGWLAPDSTAGLRSTLHEVLLQFPLWASIAREAKKTLRRKYSLDSMVDATVAVYHEVLSSAN